MCENCNFLTITVVEVSVALLIPYYLYYLPLNCCHIIDNHKHIN